MFSLRLFIGHFIGFVFVGAKNVTSVHVAKGSPVAETSLDAIEAISDVQGKNAGFVRSQIIFGIGIEIPKEISAFRTVRMFAASPGPFTIRRRFIFQPATRCRRVGKISSFLLDIFRGFAPMMRTLGQVVGSRATFRKKGVRPGVEAFVRYRYRSASVILTEKQIHELLKEIFRGMGASTRKRNYLKSRSINLWHIQAACKA